MPGQLDFPRMRRAAGLPEGAEILAGIASMPEGAQHGAWAAVEEIELEMMSFVKLQPGLVALITALRARGLRMVRPIVALEWLIASLIWLIASLIWLIASLIWLIASLIWLIASLIRCDRSSLSSG